MSAGIDSSTVVALMQSLNKGRVKSFTIGMEEKDYNEAVYAGEIARHLGTEHTELYITEEDAKAVIPKLAGMFGEPFADSSQIPTFLRIYLLPFCGADLEQNERDSLFSKKTMQ